MVDDLTNLIYNGDFSKGTEGWPSLNATNCEYDFTDQYDGSSGCLSFHTSSNVQPTLSQKIPVIRGCQYKFECDIKCGTITTTNYICIMSYDINGVNLALTQVGEGSSKMTTLASELKNGDTTVYLTSASGWFTSGTNPNVSICDSAAYNYERNLYYQVYDKTSVNTTTNTVTLSSAWAGGTWKAGTQVKNNRAGSTYIYPYYFGTGTSDRDWTHVTGTFTPRGGAKFINLAIICYKNNNCKLTNFKITNITQKQFREDYTDQTFAATPAKISTFLPNGIAKANIFSDKQTLPVRYIRDYANGSNKNTASHWCEFEAYDLSGSNRAWAANCSASSTISFPDGLGTGRADNISNSLAKPFHFIVRGDGSVKTSAIPYIKVGDNTKKEYITVDLGSIYDINKIIIWHYWADNRIYNETKTEISVDGINWTTVFDSSIEGTYTETSDGHTILLNRENLSLYKIGEIQSNTLYEI